MFPPRLSVHFPAIDDHPRAEHLPSSHHHYHGWISGDAHGLQQRGSYRTRDHCHADNVFYLSFCVRLRPQNRGGDSGWSHVFILSLQRPPGDYEEVLLPSPDGDVEIIPGFRKKFLAGQHHCWLEDNAVRREKGVMG